jgi:hypothetical protein
MVHVWDMSRWNPLQDTGYPLDGHGAHFMARVDSIVAAAEAEGSPLGALVRAGTGDKATPEDVLASGMATDAAGFIRFARENRIYSQRGVVYMHGRYHKTS